MLKITSIFLERMAITVVPCFSLTFFNLMGATVSNVLEKIVPMLLVIWSSLYLWVHRAVEINQADYL